MACKQAQAVYTRDVEAFLRRGAHEIRKTGVNPLKVRAVVAAEASARALEGIEDAVRVLVGVSLSL